MIIRKISYNKIPPFGTFWRMSGISEPRTPSIPVGNIAR